MALFWSYCLTSLLAGCSGLLLSSSVSSFLFPRFSSCLASCFFLLQLALFWLLALAPCASCLLASFAVFSSLASCFLFLLLSFCSFLLASLRNSMPVACLTRSICSRQHRDPIRELTTVDNSKKRIASGSQRGVC